MKALNDTEHQGIYLFARKLIGILSPRSMALDSRRGNFDPEFAANLPNWISKKSVKSRTKPFHGV
jgi:hypothetical protein